MNAVAAEAGVGVDEVEACLKYMGLANELFNVMNCKEPVTWSDELDNSGQPIGLRDKVCVCG